jgi:hypothetical protein
MRTWWRSTMISISFSDSVPRHEMTGPRSRQKPRYKREKATADAARSRWEVPVQGPGLISGALHRRAPALRGDEQMNTAGTFGRVDSYPPISLRARSAGLEGFEAGATRVNEPDAG